MFAIVGEPDGTLHGLNGSGRSAKGCSLDWYLENGFSEIPGNSAHAVTVPGAVNAWETLHRRFGRTDFTRLFADAIRYAEEGFAVAPRVASDWVGLVDKLSANEGASSQCLVDGKSPAAGQKFAFPELDKPCEELRLRERSVFMREKLQMTLSHPYRTQAGF